MQYEPEYRFDMDDSFNLCAPSMTCPSTSTSFSSASSTYDPFTPTSRRSTPHELATLDFDGTYNHGAHRVELTPPATMGKFMFGPIKTELDQMPYSEGLPGTPMKREPLGFDYEQMLELNMAQNASMSSLTPSNSFGMYAISPDAAIGATSFMMTPTQSLSGSEAADTSSSWSCANDSPISFFPNKQQLPNELDALDLDRHSISPYHFHDPTSPNRMRAERKMMVHEIQRKTNELQRAQIRTSRRRSVKPEPAPVDVVRRAMCKCDYPGCHKAFRRNEHLKRHKQTFHGEGPNRFCCEFCGKDQFNRQDNLNNHRKLHARPNSRNRGVEFIPAAVPVIEQEERSRKRRAPPKAKSADKRGSEY
ncbi:hypothetical protein B0J13DRAFT_99900 [Dactylonectria estremocensis]|uniref:C2H2-type domain-containing protein n=1 Tax=Dactylonectria estremocensis TaxID=1079267 RepID=A0A9P9E6H5_9HYPO|nr:hypothetical protein B0J13DRAFT_99900 [Dactylonectria estremocensis]